jgi:DNA helicase-2/ATP-dependent DNA helicase PcrA
VEPIAVDLDAAQQKAVSYRGPRLIVTGPTGSGRTTVLVERFASLVAEGLAPEKILVLTRTDSQADLLRPRLEEKLALPWEELSVHGTTGLAVRVLARAGMEVGLYPEVSVLSAADRLALLGDAIDSLILEAHDLGRDPIVLLGTLVERIDRLEEEMVDSQAFLGWAEGLDAGHDSIADAERELEFAHVWVAHDRMLAERGARSAPAAIRDAVGLLERNPALREKLSADWEQVIADGVEDFDNAAWRLVELLGLTDGSLTVITNPAEGSRRLRGAFSSHKESLMGLDPKPELVELSTVHRASSEREFWQATNERAQAQAIAADVERLVLKEGVPANRIAVVVESPTREAPAIEVALEERAMPNRVNSGQAFFQRGEIRDLLAWLRLLVDPADGAAVARALARPPIGLGAADIASCSKIARKRKIDLVAGARAATESPQVPPEARDRLFGFLRLHRLATQAVDVLRPDLFVHRLIERLGLRASLAYSASPQAAERLRALAVFGEIAAAHVRRDPQATARDFARHITAIARSGFPGSETGIAMPPGDYPAVEIVGLNDLRDREFDHIFIAGLDAGRTRTMVRQAAEPLPEPLLPEVLPAASEKLGETVSRQLLRAAVGKATTRVVFSHSRTGTRGDSLHPSPYAEDLRMEAGAEWEERETELFSPGESLEATYRIMRDELLEVIESTGSSMLELKLDTGDEVDQAVVRFLELLKLSALAGRPDGHAAAESLAAVNERLRAVATDSQREALTTSRLDNWITDADAGARDRDRVLSARSEPSLQAFLPRHGQGLALSAGDLETYRTCPLRYKFARVMRVPQDPTIAQRFGIVVHQVLERWHRGEGGSQQDLLNLLDRSWRRSGLGEGERERQLKTKARDALVRYHARDGERHAETVWLERGFAFKIGPHTVRGRVDRVDLREDGEYELIDYKTSFPKTVDELRDDIQLTIYSIGASDAWELEAVKRSYWYVLDDDRVEVPGGVNRDEMEATVHQVAEGILSQEFEPSPSYSACSICDWRLACPAAER